MKNSMTRSWLNIHENEETPKYYKAEIAMTAAFEQLAREFIKIVVKESDLDNMDLRTLDSSLMRLIFRTQDHLRAPRGAFKTDHLYSRELPFTEKDLKKFIGSINPEINLTNSGFEYMCYLLSDAYDEMFRVSDLFRRYRGNALAAQAVQYAVEVIFSDGMARSLNAEISRAIGAYREAEKERDPPKRKTKKSSDDEEVEDDAEAEEDEEDAGEDEDEDDEDVPEDDDEEEEEESKPTPKKNTKKAGTKAKPKTRARVKASLQERE